MRKAGAHLFAQCSERLNRLGAALLLKEGLFVSQLRDMIGVDTLENSRWLKPRCFTFASTIS
jgi:hypothetical protein